MFLKNSFVLLFLALHCFSFSLKGQTSKKEELIIPDLQIEERIKIVGNRVKVKEDLDLLKSQNQIIIRKGEDLYYYKVIEKYQEELLEEVNADNTSFLVFYNEKNSFGLHTVVVALNTGKLMKND